MSVRREAANVLPVIAGIRDSAVQLVFTLGSVVSMSKLGSIITSALPVATVLICVRAYVLV
jgi:flagellar motor component MotA